MRLVLEQGYRASNAEGVSAAMQAVLGVGTVSVETVGRLKYTQWSLVNDGISATRVESSGAVVHVDAEPAPDMVVIALRTGYLVLQHGNERVALQAGDLGLVPIDHAVRASWEQVTMELFSFPRASLGGLLSPDVEQVEIRTARLKASSPAVARLWKRTASGLSEDVLRNPELADSDVIREQIINALLGLTIEAFGITDANEQNAEDDQARLQQAITCMEHNIARPISITDLAREIGTSIRGLQLVFQRTGHSTPQAHLRSMRMAVAKHALSTATPPLDISDIAERVGYTNLGRFDAHYLDAYDRLPEDEPAPAEDNTAAQQ